jgi:oxygen-dependent protoporphyrinogen oxidase
MGFLPLSLAAKIGEDLFFGIADCRLRAADSGGSLAVEFTHNGARQSVSAQHVIVATPSEAAGKLLAPLSDELARLLAEIYYPPLAIAYLGYEVSRIKTPLNGFGFLVAPSEDLSILGCVWNSSLFPGRAPAGNALLTVFVGGARKPETAMLPDGELVSLVHSELQAILGITGEPKVVDITRLERAIPQYNVGHLARVKRIEELLTQFPGLSLAGNYMHGVSTGDVVKEADAIATLLFASHNK